MGKRVIIVGAGIIGASFAWHLARAGARVSVFDALETSGGVATPKSWAWINGSWGNPEPYFRLRHQSMELWRALPSLIANLQVRWCGGLLWDLPPAELEAYVRQQSSWGYDVRLVGSEEASRIEPNLREVPALAAHAPREGVVEPVHAVDALLAAAKSLGADIVRGVKVTGLQHRGSKVTGVVTSSGAVDADEVVVAAGTATPAMLASIDIKFPLEEPEGLLVHTNPVPQLLNGLVMAPELHVRQTNEGRLVAGSDFGGMDPGHDPDGAAQRLFKRLKELVRSGDQLQYGSHTTGRRPTVPDGVSAVGHIGNIEGLYVCVTHSGITLAPALGQFGALEILEGTREKLLQPFSPNRLLS